MASAMASLISELPQIPQYTPTPPTQESLDYAELAIIDLSKAQTPEGRRELAVQVRDALRDIGFFYLINHGYSQEENKRIFDIADVPFTQVSDEEKHQYSAKVLDVGSYQGYKLRRYWHLDNGVRDELEYYNINRDVTKRQHPEPVRPLLPEVDRFAKHNHLNVLHPILRLMAIGLELPEDAFVNIHGYDAVGDTYVRFMKYYPHTEDEETRTNHVWLKGHTDIGSITILWSQPVSALQILSPDGKWRWIKHIDNALVVNAGDTMEFLSGGYYRATIHRVVQPPRDQQGYPRVGVFYFTMTDDDIKLVPFAQSPVLQREGIKRRFKDEDAPIMEQWRKGRTKSYGLSGLKKTENGVEEEVVLNGIVVKHYN